VTVWVAIFFTKTKAHQINTFQSWTIIKLKYLDILIAI
jgi:hypothetical protein